MSEFPSREHSEQLGLRRARRYTNAIYAIAQRCDAAARFVALEATDKRAFESEKEKALGTSGGTPRVTVEPTRRYAVSSDGRMTWRTGNGVFPERQ